MEVDIQANYRVEQRLVQVVKGTTGNLQQEQLSQSN